MWDKIFYVLWTQAAHFTDKKMYIAAMRSSFSWRRSPVVNAELGNLWDLCHTNVKGICKLAGLTQKDLAIRFAISQRVIESWCGSQQRACKAYNRLMMLENLGLLDRQRLEPYFIEDNREQP